MKKLKQQSKKHHKHSQSQSSPYADPSAGNVAIPSCCQLPTAGCPGCYSHYPNPAASCHISYLSGGCSCLQQQHQQIYQNSSHRNEYPRGAIHSGPSSSSLAPPPTITKPTNIVATMELFEPRASTSSSGPHQDYSYAYYEPGAALRHSNIPSYMYDHGSTSGGTGPSGQQRTPGTSGGSSSMRALIALGGSSQRNRLYGGRRSGSGSRFPGSPCENIYEEIIHEENEAAVNAPLASPSSSTYGGPSSSGRLSLMSLNQSVIVEEEFRQVQNCHRKVLGELNLSVEAMLMPGNVRGDDMRSQEDDYQRGVVNYRRKSYGMGQSTDLDSGFSGSSGGTSYIGNLRARKTEARMLSLQQQSHHQSMMLFEGMGQEDTRSIASCNSMDRSSGGGSVKALCKGKGNLSKLFSGSTRSLKKLLESADGSRKGTHSTPSSPTFVKSNKVGFWSKKSWTKKLSSSGALHRSFEEDETKPYQTADSSWDSSLLRTTLEPQPPTGNQQKHHQRQLSTTTITTTADVVADYRPQLIPYPSERSTKLDYKPSTRTVSSEDSCYSEDRYISSDEDDDDDDDEDEEDEIDLDENDIREEYLRRGNQRNRRNNNHHHQEQPPKNSTPKEVAGFEEQQQSVNGGTGGGDRRRSITQLQNTLNKAKAHLSFDKWKSHHGGGGSSSSSNSVSLPLHRPVAAAGGGAGGNVHLIADLVNNNNSSSSNHSNSRGSAHASAMSTTAATATPSPVPPVGMSPGSASLATAANASPSSTNSSPSISSEPFSRLSRWFSIRRGSMNQYDVKGHNSTTAPTTTTTHSSSAGGKENRRNSIDHVDSTGSLFGGKFDGGKLAMNKVLEADEDPYQLALDSFAMTRGAGTEPKTAERRHIPVALPVAPSGLNQQQLKRRHIVAAIIHSENSYVSSLQRLVNEYKRPLEESNPPILNPSKTAILFHRLPEILQLHTLFRISLADYIQSWDSEEKIGDVFVATFASIRARSMAIEKLLMKPL